MRKTILGASVAFSLCACAAGKAPPELMPYREAWTYPEQQAQYTGHDVINVVGTPFYALFKGVTCVASAVVAVPVAIGLSMGERPERQSVRAKLDRGVGANCGGSYVLGAY